MAYVYSPFPPPCRGTCVKSGVGFFTGPSPRFAQSSPAENVARLRIAPARQVVLTYLVSQHTSLSSNKVKGIKRLRTVCICMGRGYTIAIYCIVHTATPQPHNVESNRKQMLHHY